MEHAQRRLDIVGVSFEQQNMVIAKNALLGGVFCFDRSCFSAEKEVI